ncbi:DUF6783 domain-containing protein [Clostridium transplantifaecale]
MRGSLFLGKGGQGVQMAGMNFQTRSRRCVKCLWVMC